MKNTPTRLEVFPVFEYNRLRIDAILHDRLPITDIVNVKVTPLDAAFQGYQSFDQMAAAKYVLNPYGDFVKAA